MSNSEIALTVSMLFQRGQKVRGDGAVVADRRRRPSHDAGHRPGRFRDAGGGQVPLRLRHQDEGGRRALGAHHAQGRQGHGRGRSQGEKYVMHSPAGELEMQKKTLNGFQGCHENVLNESCEMSPHLICLQCFSQSRRAK